MPQITSQDTTIYYDYQPAQEQSAKPLIVFIHGLTLDSRSWNFIQPHFVKLGYSTLAYDIRGHGKSGVPPSGYGVVRRVQDLKQVLDEVGIKDNLVLVGHSLGGSEAISYAVTYPEAIKGLVLIDSWIAGFRPTENSPMRFNANSVAQQQSVQAAIEGFRELGLFDLQVKREESKELLEKIQKDHPGGFWLDDRSIRDPSFKAREKLDTLSSIPALVLVGEQDFEDFQTIANLLDVQLPLSTKKIIPGVKHMGPFDKPEEIADMIEQWLQTVSN